MRIGIMGGTLDPVHNGHLQLAQAARELLHLDRIMLLPAGDPPHKHRTTLKSDRMQMAQLAAASCEGVFACTLEINRNGTTYTVDTLHELREMNPNVHWYYIIGADTLDVLDTWRNFGEVAKLCTFAVMGRADAPANPERAAQLSREYGAQFELLPFDGPQISSTDVRCQVAEGRSIAHLVPEAVNEYICKHGLYLCGKSREEILEKLRTVLKPSRLEHTVGVAETAVALAERYGVEPRRAELAALLHDCAKYVSRQELCRLVEENIPDTDPDELASESVLHAPAGSILAYREYGVRDKSILSAIRKHTIGDAEMSALDALIYTADFIEPGRKPFPGLDEVRKLAEEDIFAAMCRCAELTNAYLLQQGKQPHPKSIRMLEKYKDRIHKEEQT